MGDFWLLAPIKKITEHMDIFVYFVYRYDQPNFQIPFQYKISNQNITNWLIQN